MGLLDCKETFWPHCITDNSQQLCTPFHFMLQTAACSIAEPDHLWWLLLRSLRESEKLENRTYAEGRPACNRQ